MQNDLDRAKALLKRGGYTCALVKGEKTLVSGKRGVAPLLELIDEGKDLNGFAAADKIVGKAAAMLYAYMGVKEVYGEVLSTAAAEFLRAHGIAAQCGVSTERIRNRRGDGICAMERGVENISDPVLAVAALREKLRGMDPTA